ncbi:WYL domain-containing protein [Streptomyces sp. NPDC088178]|uniref:WYL domain-containing protein n=1 Tax=Streptomyces sp. NPDC088178 TaxID=3365836 RepID=UPI0037F7FC64
MKNTKQQSSTKTLADLYRAIDRQHAVSLTYLAPGDTEPTIRTVEIHEVRTTKNGGIVIVAMCRLRGEERQFVLAGVLSYTLHRIAYVLDRPAPTTYERPAPAPATDAEALFSYELARDQDDADYTPRTLIQTDAALAA